MSFRSARWMIVPVAAMSLSACGIHSVPTKEEAAKANWANVAAAYPPRPALLPNLVATAKGAAQLEQSTLAVVIQSRSPAPTAKLSTVALTNPAKLKEHQ